MLLLFEIESKSDIGFKEHWHWYAFVLVIEDYTRPSYQVLDLVYLWYLEYFDFLVHWHKNPSLEINLDYLDYLDYY